jgi:UDP-glucose 4-epimerase
MKKILLLGGYGFIGTNILKYIDNYFSNVFSVVVFDRSLNHFHGLTFNCLEKVYEGDYADKTIIKSIFDENKFDYVIHTLNTTVPSTSMNARFDIESNLLPTLDLLDILVEYKTPNIIYISSGGAIYGEMINNLPHKETNIEFPKSSYGVVKLAIEKYLLQYKELFQINPLILRLSNPYGLYHYSLKQGIINVGLRYAIMEQQFEVWGNGEAIKDYIFIGDFCMILFEMIKQDINEGIYNVGSNEILSVNHILTQIKLHFPKFSHFQLDTNKLFQAIKPIKFTPFNVGLLKTIEWLQNEK